MKELPCRSIDANIKAQVTAVQSRANCKYFGRLADGYITISKIIAKSRSLIDPAVFTSQLTPLLEEMTKDSDLDVAYFAKAALH